MGSKRSQPVPRPLKQAEYQIRFATREAEKGWIDLVATVKNALADAWDFLTRTPQAGSEKVHQLRGDLAYTQVQGIEMAQWQYELPGGARIWYTVGGSPDGKHAGIVFLVRVCTSHPNETIGNYR